MAKCFEEFVTVKRENKNSNADQIYEYSKYYLSLIEKYKEEIEFTDNLFQEFRAEERDFYEVQLHNVRETMKADGVKPETIDLWLNDFQDSMKKSFDISRSMITTFTVDKLEEFKAEIKEKIDKV